MNSRAPCLLCIGAARAILIQLCRNLLLAEPRQRAAGATLDNHHLLRSSFYIPPRATSPTGAFGIPEFSIPNSDVCQRTLFELRISIFKILPGPEGHWRKIAKQVDWLAGKKGKSVKKPTLPEQIANQLRRNILLGELPAGSSVKERDNAASLGVSRTPMREATRILAQEGLVILRPSRSPIVADPSLKEVMDDLVVMGVLEVLSGELACQNASDDEIRHISEIHEELALVAHAKEPIDAFEIDMQFHREIAGASHNPALAETHRAYLARLWRIRYLSASIISNRDRSISQHAKIVNGLKKRDSEMVAREIRSHMDQLVTNISHLFAKRDAEHVA